jgi:hypothetical protein
VVVDRLLAAVVNAYDTTGGRKLTATRRSTITLRRTVPLLAAAMMLWMLACAAGPTTGAFAGYDCPQAFGSFGTGHWPPACWRAYGLNSPFNQPLPAHPRLAANWGTVVRYMRQNQWNFTSDPRGNIALRSDGSRPVYWSTRSDPTVTIRCTGDNGFCQRHLFPLRIHIPAGARPETASDGHMTVVDQSRGYEYDFWKAQIVRRGRMVVASGCRLREGAGSGTGLHGCAEAAWLGLQAGLIREPELAAGRIDHALIVSMPCTAARRYVWPATSPNGYDCAPGDPAPPLGGLLRLNMSDRAIARTRAPRWEQAIFTAMAHYGMYVVDTEGGGHTMQLISEDDISFTSLGFRGGIGHFIRTARGGYYWQPIQTWILIGKPIDLSRLQLIASCVPRHSCGRRRR